MLLYSETPNVYKHTMKIGIIDVADFEGEFSFDFFRAEFKRRLYQLEPLRLKLVDTPMKLHHPMWLETSDIDLNYHLHQVRVRAPGGRRELDELVGDIAGSPLDRSRPLWEMYFVEGMAEHRFAVIGKIHHALADGVASANLMAKMMDQNPMGGGQRPNDNPLPSSRELLQAAWRDHVHQLGRLPALARETASGIRRVRSHVRERGEKSGFGKQLPPPTF